MTIQVGNATTPASTAQLLALNEAIGIAYLPFNPIIPLRYAAAQMPRITVNTTLVFAPGVNPLPGSTCICTLIGDGLNTPLFSGMTKLNTSFEYVKDAGVRNIVQFYFDGEVVWYSIMQASGTVVVAPAPTPAPAPGPAPAPSPTAGAPGAPTNVVATAGVTSASVAFTAPASNGGAAIIVYTVTASSGQTATGLASPINVPGLTAGTAVTFTVKARNSVGSSVASAASTAVTPTASAPAPAPAGVTFVRADPGSRGSGLAETGNATSGFSYDSLGGGSQFGIGDTAFVLAPITGDGAFRVRTGSKTNNGFGIIGLSPAQASGVYTNWPYAVVQNDGGFEAFSSGGSPTGTLGPVPVEFSTEYQLRRAGTTVYAEASTDGFATAGTVIKTWTGVTGPLYCSLAVYGTGGVQVIRIVA